MKYVVRVKKRVRYLRAYSIKQRVGERENALTKLFSKMFGRKQKDSALPA